MIVMMFPFVYLMEGYYGGLICYAGFLFLFPAWNAYRTYREYKKAEVFRPLHEAEIADRGKAFNRICKYLILFGLCEMAGCSMLFRALSA